LEKPGGKIVLNVDPHLGERGKRVKFLPKKGIFKKEGKKRGYKF